MSEVVVDDGMTIHYDVFGRRDGTPLVMIQGLGTDSRGWALQRLALGRQFRCITIDNRGVGRTGPAPEPYSLERMAARRDRGARPGAHRAGPRDGRLDGRGDRPDHRRPAPGADPVARSSPAPRAAITSGAASCSRNGPRPWSAAGMAALGDESLQWLVGPRLRRRFGIWLNLIARVVLQQAPGTFVAQIRAILDAPDELRNELVKIRVPVLVITGSQDALTPRRRRRGARRADPARAPRGDLGRRARADGRGAERLQRSGAAVPRRRRRRRRRARRAGRVGLIVPVRVVDPLA